MRTVHRVSTHLVFSDDPRGILSDALTTLGIALSMSELAEQLRPSGRGWSCEAAGVWQILDPTEFHNTAENEPRGAARLCEGREVWEVWSDYSASQGAVVLEGDEVRALAEQAVVLMADVREASRRRVGGGSTVA